MVRKTILQNLAYLKIILENQSLLSHTEIIGIEFL